MSSATDRPSKSALVRSIVVIREFCSVSSWPFNIKNIKTIVMLMTACLAVAMADKTHAAKDMSTEPAARADKETGSESGIMEIPTGAATGTASEAVTELKPTTATTQTKLAKKSSDKLRLCAGCLDLGDNLLIGIKLEARGRVEAWKNTDDTNCGLLRNRLMLKVEWKGIGTNLEWIDAREAFTQEDRRTQVNPVDVVQANVYWRDILSTPWTLRVGRQTINVGSRRLVAAPTWKNNIRAFEAVRLTGQRNGRWKLDSFAGRRVIISSDKLDTWEKGEVLWCVFAQAELYSRFVTEAYFYGFHQGDVSANGKPIIGEDGEQGRTDRYTSGVRLDLKVLGSFRLELESMIQLGHRANDDVLAFAGEADIYYTFDVWGKPQLQLLYSVATGDLDPNDERSNTFIPLFASVHSYHGHLDLFRAQNFHEVGLTQQVRPIKSLLLRTAMHTFSLYTRNDNWYNTTGKIVRPASEGLPKGIVGVEVDGLLHWAVFPFWELEIGGGYFFSRWVPAPKRNAFIWGQMLFRIGAGGQPRSLAPAVLGPR